MNIQSAVRYLGGGLPSRHRDIHAIWLISPSRKAFSCLDEWKGCVRKWDRGLSAAHKIFSLVTMVAGTDRSGICCVALVSPAVTSLSFTPLSSAGPPEGSFSRRNRGPAHLPYTLSR